MGSRWQLRDGDRAEPSDTYVAVVRVGGVVFLIAAASFTIWHFSLQAEAERRESLSTAWDVLVAPDYELDVIDNPEVVRVNDVEAALGALSGPRVGLSTWRTAVIGQDEVGDLGVTVHDGDLWMAAIAGSCTPEVLMVRETPTSVTIAMTASMTYFDGLNTYLTCSSRFGSPTLDTLVAVRVPLEEPVGNREVITVRPPERDDVGGPEIPIPGVTENPATPTPTPTP
jgi:hypothetical protein